MKNLQALTFDYGWFRHFAAFALLSYLAFAGQDLIAADDRPNIVLIMADDMGEKLLPKAKSTGIYRIVSMIIMRFKSSVLAKFI